jgi:hypothetical protein
MAFSNIGFVTYPTIQATQIATPMVIAIQMAQKCDSCPPHGLDDLKKKKLQDDLLAKIAQTFAVYADAFAWRDRIRRCTLNLSGSLPGQSQYANTALRLP